MNTYWKMKVKFHTFLTSTPDGTHLNAQGTPGVHRMGGWAGPRDGMNVMMVVVVVVVKTIIPVPAEIEPRSSSPTDYLTQ
jgi:hypothetical protein